HQQQQQDQNQYYQNRNDTITPPSEAEISAIFGLPSIEPPTIQQPKPSSSVMPPSPASNSNFQQYHQTPAQTTPVTISHAPRSMVAAFVPENERANLNTPPPYNSELQIQQENQQYYNQQQHHQQQHTSCNNFYTNQYNNYGFSNANDSNMYGNQYTMTNVDITSTKNQSASNPMMLNEPSQSLSAPKIAKAAASYVSSTLAVTSNFASSKLATASTKIADLWQHNQQVLPQQQQRPQQQHQQQNQQQNLYNGNHHYNTDTPTINSANYSSSGSNNNNMQNSYEGGQEINSNYNYQSLSYNNQNHNYSTNNNSSCSGAINPFASTTTSKLSNVASVAGSYLPSLTKFPTLPALPAMPSLPWGDREKNLQLPQQQPQQQQQQQQQQSFNNNSYSHYDTQNTQQNYSSERYYDNYNQEQSYQQQQQQQQSNMGYQGSVNDNQLYGDSSASTGNWWGEIRNEVQKRRRIVASGVQAGVAWWWDTDQKNTLGNFV
ncbi:hypothetical protein BGZ76_004342, partial [Entomortierella beljakovae]